MRLGDHPIGREERTVRWNEAEGKEFQEYSILMNLPRISFPLFGDCGRLELRNFKPWR